MIKLTFFKKYAVLMLSIFVLASCASRKDLIYLQNDNLDSTKVDNNYQLIFKPDDLLQIIVTSKDLEASIDFNLPVVAFTTTPNVMMNQPQLQNYLVDKDGFIDFPILGKIKVGGLSRNELIEYLKKEIDPKYIKNPIINILITNFKISVQGDVQRPGTFSLQSERVSIFDALALAGDLNISADRWDVRVIRELNNEKLIYSVDLRSKKILTSPVYYLQQNDVVIVNPNNARIQDSSYTRAAGLFISLASVLISLLTILTR